MHCILGLFRNITTETQVETQVDIFETAAELREIHNNGDQEDPTGCTC